MQVPATIRARSSLLITAALAAAVTKPPGAEVDVVENETVAVTLLLAPAAADQAAWVGPATEPAFAAAALVAPATNAAGSVSVTLDSPCAPHVSQLATTVVKGIAGAVWEAQLHLGTVKVAQYSTTTREAGFVGQTVV